MTLCFQFPAKHGDPDIEKNCVMDSMLLYRDIALVYHDKRHINGCVYVTNLLAVSRDEPLLFQWL